MSPQWSLPSPVPLQVESEQAKKHSQLLSDQVELALVLPHPLKLWQHPIHKNTEMPIIMNTPLIFWEVMTPGSFEIEKKQCRNGQAVLCRHCNSSSTLFTQSTVHRHQLFFWNTQLAGFLYNRCCLSHSTNFHSLTTLPAESTQVFFFQSFLSFWVKFLGLNPIFLNEELNYHKGLQKSFDTLMI